MAGGAALGAANITFDNSAASNANVAAAARDPAAAREVLATRETVARAEAMRREAAAQRDAAISGARIALETAEDRLAKLRQPPSPSAVQAARRSLDDARGARSAAQDRLNAVRNGSDALTLSAADAELSKARLGLEQAQAQLAKLESPTREPESAQQSSTVESARVAVANAEAQLDSLRARAQLGSQPDSGAELRTYDRLVMVRGLEQERATLRVLENELAAMTLRAPFSGVVGSLPAQPGGRAEAGRTVIVLTNPGDPILEANILPADTTRIAPGQKVEVQLDGEVDRLAGAVLSVGRSTSGTGRVVRMQVSWGTPRPTLGSGGRAEIVVGAKSDALIVPRRAIRSSEDRNFVEKVEGDTRQFVEVMLGMSSTNDVEVLDGLAEGQTVWVGP
jgi:multidrug efflux pump subunit AcrA (membrane-fusion protein)